MARPAALAVAGYYPFPEHLLGALAAEVRLAPDDPATGLPALLVKGVYRREYVDVRTIHDKNGALVSTVQVERPRLTLTALDLATSTYHRLAVTGDDGATPPAPAGLTLGSLCRLYRRDLLALLTERFPALHRPDRAADQLPLPPLGRTLYAAQHQAVQAALKLLARSVNPFLLCEVGAGKSTMALAIAAACAHPHRDRLLAALRAQQPYAGGQRVRLPRVGAVLILCPPHLLDSWREEIGAVLPSAMIRVLTGVRDVDAALATGAAASTEAGPGAALVCYLLSRETAKLGPGLVGGAARTRLGAVCPRCGAPVATEEARLVSGRARCAAIPVTAAN